MLNKVCVAETNCIVYVELNYHNYEIKSQSLSPILKWFRLVQTSSEPVLEYRQLPEPEPELNFRFSSEVQVRTLGSELNFNSPRAGQRWRHCHRRHVTAARAGEGEAMTMTW